MATVFLAPILLNTQEDQLPLGTKLDHSPHTYICIPEVVINALTTTKILPHAHADILSRLIDGMTSPLLPTQLTLQLPFLRPSLLGYP